MWEWVVLHIENISIVKAMKKCIVKWLVNAYIIAPTHPPTPSFTLTHCFLCYNIPDHAVQHI